MARLYRFMETAEGHDGCRRSPARTPGHRVRRLNHDAGKLFGGGHVLREERLQQRVDGPNHRVESAIPIRLGFSSMQRLNVARTKHVRGLEGQAQQRVLGLPLHASPDGAPAFSTVSSGARYINECHVWV